MSATRYRDSGNGPYPHPDGEWVRLEDYERRTRELNEIRSALVFVNKQVRSVTPDWHAVMRRLDLAGCPAHGLDPSPIPCEHCERLRSAPETPDKPTAYGGANGLDNLIHALTVVLRSQPNVSVRWAIWMSDSAAETAAEPITQVVNARVHGFPKPTYHANTPICPKCGQVDVRIPRMGIYHVCPESAEKAAGDPT